MEQQLDRQVNHDTEQVSYGKYLFIMLSLIKANANGCDKGQVDVRRDCDKVLQRSSLSAGEKVQVRDEAA